jgi:hypothetical protein
MIEVMATSKVSTTKLPPDRSISVEEIVTPTPVRSMEASTIPAAAQAIPIWIIVCIPSTTPK